jgi:hypothetical protein
MSLIPFLVRKSLWIYSLSLLIMVLVLMWGIVKSSALHEYDTIFYPAVGERISGFLGLIALIGMLAGMIFYSAKSRSYLKSLIAFGVIVIILVYVLLSGIVPRPNQPTPLTHLSSVMLNNHTYNLAAYFQLDNAFSVNDATPGMDTGIIHDQLYQCDSLSVVCHVVFRGEISEPSLTLSAFRELNLTLSANADKNNIDIQMGDETVYTYNAEMSD